MIKRIDENNVMSEAIKQHRNGFFKKAKDLYRAILTQNPRNADAIFRLGTMALQFQQYDKAVSYINQAIILSPKISSMYINLGAAYIQLNQHEEAILAYDKALNLDPNNPNAYFNKGRALQTLDRPLKTNQNSSSCTTWRLLQITGARECYKRAIEINSKEPDTWVNLGVVEHELGDHISALNAFEMAARIDPECAAAYANSAAVLFDKGLHEISQILMDKAISLQPDNVDYKYRLSLFMLSSERLEKGWKYFDTRFEAEEKAKAALRAVPPEYWKGGSLKNKKLLLWTEQGLGEELLGLGILSDLINTGASIHLQCSKRMLPIVKENFPTLNVSSWGKHRQTVDQELPPFVFQCQALSAMKYLYSNTDAIRRDQPYIVADPVLANEYRQRYIEKARGKKIIGISWRSGNQKIGEAKSIPIEAWKPILETKGVLFVNLQYGDCTEDIKNIKNRLGVDIFVDKEIDPLGNLAPVFAQIAATDLVLSVSNSNIHIAGSMGVSAWSIIPASKGRLWFWFTERTDSPWYPSVKLFRQTSSVGAHKEWWSEPVDAIASSLSKWLNSRAKEPSP